MHTFPHNPPRLYVGVIVVTVVELMVEFLLVIDPSKLGFCSFRWNICDCDLPEARTREYFHRQYKRKRW